MVQTLNLQEFQETVDKFSLQLERDIWPDFVRKVGFDLFCLMVKGTPVAEGRAKGNWQVQFGTPATGVLDVLDPSGAQTIARGLAQIGRVTGRELVYFSNNIPYIEALEMGHSKQAPSGWVAQAVETARINLRNP